MSDEDVASTVTGEGRQQAPVRTEVQGGEVLNISQIALDVASGVAKAFSQEIAAALAKEVTKVKEISEEIAKIRDIAKEVANEVVKVKGVAEEVAKMKDMVKEVVKEGMISIPQFPEVQKVKVEPEHTGWGRLLVMVREYDEGRIKDIKEDMDTLLVFAGLFSAVLTAFVIETYKRLEADSGDKAYQALVQISAQLANLTAAGTSMNSTASPFIDKSFLPTLSFVRINTLWSCSLIISLITASFAILVKQWLHEYMALETHAPLPSLRTRFFRHAGLMKWQVFEIGAALPLLLQVALLLFFIGLSEFLRQLHPVVGWASTAITASWMAIFAFTTIAPIFSLSCPYKTPILKRSLSSLRILLLDAYDSWFPPYSSSPTRLLEEEIREKSDALNMTIITSSHSLFLDEQLMSTLYECSNDIDAEKIVDFYNHFFKPERAKSIPDTWMVSITPEAKKDYERMRRLVGALLVHKIQHYDCSHEKLLMSILDDGKSGPWWDILPTLLVQIIQSNFEFGAVPTFLWLSKVLRGKEVDALTDLYRHCARATNHSKEDAQYLANLVGITGLAYECVKSILQARFGFDYLDDGDPREHRMPISLEPISKQYPFDIRVEDLRKWDPLNPGTFTSLLNTFSILLNLASSKAIREQKENIERIILAMGDMLILRGPNILSEAIAPNFAQCIHHTISYGLVAPFLLLYLAVSKESFDHQQMSQMYGPRHVHNTQQHLDTLLTAANAVKNYFWPCSPSGTSAVGTYIQDLITKHEIKADIGVFCFTYSRLLAYTYRRQRLEDAMQLLSDILGLVEKATVDTTVHHRRVYFSTNALLQSNLIFGRDLETRLFTLHDSLLERLHPDDRSNLDLNYTHRGPDGTSRFSVAMSI